MSNTWSWWCWDCMKEVGYNHIKWTEDRGGCTGYCKNPHRIKLQAKELL
jgi:hypothetical protein